MCAAGNRSWPSETAECEYPAYNEETMAEVRGICLVNISISSHLAQICLGRGPDTELVPHALDYLGHCLRDLHGGHILLDNGVLPMCDRVLQRASTAQRRHHPRMSHTGVGSSMEPTSIPLQPLEMAEEIR